LELPRPHLFVVPATLGVCGVFLAWGNPDTITLILGTLIPVLGWAGAQVFNDLFDVEVDRVKHPEWPIPSGNVSKREAVVYGLSLYAASLILAALVNVYCLAASLIGLGLATIYSYMGKIKEKGILRNFCFGMSVAACILVGSAATGKVSLLSVVVIILAALIYTSDNIIGRFPDVEIDRMMNIRTLPLRVGLKRAAEIALLLVMISVCIAMFLWLLGLHISYLPLGLLAGAALLWTNLAVLKDPERFGTLWIIHARYMSQLSLFLSFIVGVVTSAGLF